MEKSKHLQNVWFQQLTEITTLAGSSGTNSPGKVFPLLAISISADGNKINTHR
jgi:hypothetical protein